MENNDLTKELARLILEDECLKRNLDKNYCDLKTRTKIFNKIKENRKQIEKIKFRIKLEKEMIKNEKSREKI